MPLTAEAAEAVKTARTRLQGRDARGAIVALKAAIAGGERTGEMLELLGVAQGMAGNTSASRQAFEDATRLEPGRASAHYNYAVVLSRDGELEMAAEEANTAAYLDPKHAGVAILQKQLIEQIRHRKLIGDEAFTTVGRGPSTDAMRCGVLGQLTCPVCGKNNLFSARVCRHCGTFIKEMPDIVPVE